MIAEYPDPNINDGVKMQHKKKIIFFNFYYHVSFR